MTSKYGTSVGQHRGLGRTIELVLGLEKAALTKLKHVGTTSIAMMTN